MKRIHEQFDTGAARGILPSCAPELVEAAEDHHSNDEEPEDHRRNEEGLTR